MLLERVIGNTVKASSSFAVNPATGDFAYPAGCVLVFYSPRRNRQTQFFSCENNRPLTSVAFSGDGKYVCAAEGGRQPAVLVWDVANGKLLAQLKGHAFSVKCVAFSADGKMLASAGSQSDGRLHVWNWRAGMLLASARVKSEVRSLCFSSDGQLLMSAGMQGHLKYWELQAPSVSGKCRVLKGKKAVLDGGPETVGDFVDIAVTKCSEAGRACYAVTGDGFLLSFDADRNLDKWVDVKVAGSFSLSVTDTHIACACSDGVVRLFHAPTLEYISTLPRPPRFRPAGAPPPSTGDACKAQAVGFPDALAVQLTADNQRAGCIYADRSFFVWDLREPSKVCRCRAMHAHSGSIWDLDFLPAAAALRAGLPADSFVTCGSDSTIRVWGLAPQDANRQPEMGQDGMQKPAPSRDLRAMAMCTDGNAGSVHEQTGGGIRCIKVSPDGSKIASGDRVGNLRVHSLSTAGEVLQIETFLEAHDAEILSLDYGGHDGNLLASAARDRLIHVFDQTKNYDTVCTLDDHAAAVTSVRFAPHGTRLMSCGGDKRIIFRSLVNAPPTPSATKTTQLSASTLRVDALHTQSMPFGTVYDMCVDRTGRLALSVGQDNGLVVWDISTGAKKRRYSTESECTLRVRLDPSGMFAATTGSDKGIRLHDFHSGDIVCMAFGHSEPVTAISFSPALDRLVSASGDGCIFVWQLPQAVTRTMISRQNEVALQSSVESVDSTPREVTRVSGAGVFSMTPSPKKSKTARPTIADLRKIAGEGADTRRGMSSQRDEQVMASQRSMLSALLDDSQRSSANNLPKVKTGNWTSEIEPDLPMLKPAGPVATVPAGLRKANAEDVEVSDLQSRGVDVSAVQPSTEASTVYTATDMTFEDEREVEAGADGLGLVNAHEHESDKTLDFTVLTSEGVRMSRGLELNGVFDGSGRSLHTSARPGNASGLGDMLESDLDDDDVDASVVEVDEKSIRQDTHTEVLGRGALLDEDDFLREAVSEKTIAVDPRSSLRASRSVGHMLLLQMRDALRASETSSDVLAAASSGASVANCASNAGLALPLVRAPHTGPLLSGASAEEGDPALQTPRGATNTSTVTDNSVLSPSARPNRSNLAHEKNVALAREIDSMRLRLQAMGMCGGGACDNRPAPTPALSAVPSLAPSVQVSPAKPKLTARTLKSTQRQLAMKHVDPDDQAVPLPNAGSEPTVDSTKKQQGPKQEFERSLFEKMRTAGAVKAQERAEAGKASSGRAVYEAIAEADSIMKVVPSLAEERQRLKDAAASSQMSQSQVHAAADASLASFLLHEGRVNLPSGISTGETATKGKEKEKSNLALVDGDSLLRSESRDESSSERPPSIPDSSEPPSLPVTDVSEGGDVSSISDRENSNANRNIRSRPSTAPSKAATYPPQKFSRKSVVDGSMPEASEEETTHVRDPSVSKSTDIQIQSPGDRLQSLLSLNPTPSKEDSQDKGAVAVETLADPTDRRTNNLRQVVQAAAVKRAEVEEARRKAEDVQKSLQAALLELEQRQHTHWSSVVAPEEQDAEGQLEAVAVDLSKEEVARLQEDLTAATAREETARLAVLETEARADILRQQAMDALQQVQALKAGEEILLARAQRETEARLTAEAEAREAATALEALQRLRGPLSPHDLPPSAGVLSAGVRARSVEFGADSTVCEQFAVRPSTAPPGDLATRDLTRDVMAFAQELGHTVVSPVMSSFKTLMPRNDSLPDDSEALKAKGYSVVSGSPFQVHDKQEQEDLPNPEYAVTRSEPDSAGNLICAPDAEPKCVETHGDGFLPGIAQPTVTQKDSDQSDVPSEMPKASHACETFRVDPDSVSPIEKHTQESSDDISTVPTASDMSVSALPKLELSNSRQMGAASMCSEKQEGEDSLTAGKQFSSGLQGRVLPLNDSDIKKDLASDAAVHTSQHASFAETVTHQSRPATAPTQRPITPGVAEGGWIGGRDGGAGSAEGGGHLTPLNSAGAMQAESLAHVSPSAGWQVGMALSLKPARQADPNHPLRVLADARGIRSLDETAVSVQEAGGVEETVYCSTLDDTQATGVTFGKDKSEMHSLPAVDAAQALRTSLGAALDLFNVARASGQRAAMADIAASLRSSQNLISDALRVYDLDLTADPMVDELRSVADAPLKAEAPAVQGVVASDPNRQLSIMVASGDPTDISMDTHTSGDASLPSTTRRLTMPALALPGKAHSDVSRTEQHATPAPSVAENQSTALPSARSSMDCGGSQYGGSQRLHFENLSEISIASEGRTVVDVEEVLERYSERLLQMVSNKLKTPSAMTGTTVHTAANFGPRPRAENIQSELVEARRALAIAAGDGAEIGRDRQ